MSERGSPSFGRFNSISWLLRQSRQDRETLRTIREVQRLAPAEECDGEDGELGGDDGPLDADHGECGARGVREGEHVAGAQFVSVHGSGEVEGDDGVAVVAHCCLFLLVDGRVVVSVAVSHTAPEELATR
jgi:hypothetical protein